MTAVDPRADAGDLSDLPPYLVLYDGVCGLRHRGVRSLMGLDKDRILHFAPPQGQTTARLAPVVARIRIAPKRVADAAYTAIAASRYRLFGKFDQCELPTRSRRERFLP
ncbi:MAG: hypothetical protein OSA99_10260 [Acidimicrobiales bacterium]|nr:hypothetical protein [Acidimicrobiales bacterium]